MATFLLPPDPIASIDRYLADGVGGAGVRRAQELGSGCDDRPGGAVGAARPRRRRVPHRPEVGRHRRAESGVGGTWCATAPRANRARSRTGPCCAPTRTSSSRVWSSPRSRSAPSEAFICLKASFRREIEAVTRAVAGVPGGRDLCGDCKVTIVAGPDEYLFGEEKAMLEVIEGNEPLPRWLPPYQHGLFATAPQLGWQSHDRRGTAPAGRRLEPDARQQRRDPVERAPHPRPGRRVVPFDGYRRRRRARS